MHSHTSNIHTSPGSATWTQNRDREPAAVGDPPAPRRRTPVVGARTELGRYQTTKDDRIVYGQRIDGIVRVTDRPTGSGGRAYLVERGLESYDELTGPGGRLPRSGQEARGDRR